MMKDLISALFYSCFGLFYLISSFKYDVGTAMTPGPGLFPRIIGFIMLLCGFLLIFSSLYNRKEKEKLSATWDGLSGKNLVSAMLVIGSVTFYLLVINYVGFLIASSILVLFLAWVMGGRNWLFNVTLGIVSSGLTYWLFWVIMRVPIPQGSLWGK